MGEKYSTTSTHLCSLSYRITALQMTNISCIILIDYTRKLVEEMSTWMYKYLVHPMLWACSVCSAAPEVLSGGPYNHAADWWSLGILLFSLVTGKVRSCCQWAHYGSPDKQILLGDSVSDVAELRCCCKRRLCENAFESSFMTEFYIFVELQGMSKLSGNLKPLKLN